MAHKRIPVPAALLARGIDAYTDEGHAAKTAMHKAGKTFLKALANALGLMGGTYDIRSNLGGIAVSGEVTLHSDDIYVQLSESCISPGLSLLYRTCNSRKDCSGHQNNFAEMANMADADKQERIVSTMNSMVARIRERKGVTA